MNRNVNQFQINHLFGLRILKMYKVTLSKPETFRSTKLFIPWTKTKASLLEEGHCTTMTNAFLDRDSDVPLCNIIAFFFFPFFFFLGV